VSTAHHRPAEADIAQCVACGLCLPHCPTFRITGRETASPRGRIAAMRAVVEDGAPIDASFLTMMDECLACRACEAACPSGVPYGRVLGGAVAVTRLVTRLPRARGRVPLEESNYWARLSRRRITRRSLLAAGGTAALGAAAGAVVGCGGGGNGGGFPRTGRGSAGAHAFAA